MGLSESLVQPTVGWMRFSNSAVNALLDVRCWETAKPADSSAAVLPAIVTASLCVAMIGVADGGIAEVLAPAPACLRGSSARTFVRTHGASMASVNEDALALGLDLAKRCRKPRLPTDARTLLCGGGANHEMFCVNIPALYVVERNSRILWQRSSSPPSRAAINAGFVVAIPLIALRLQYCNPMSAHATSSASLL